MESILPQAAGTLLTNLGLAWSVGVLASCFWLTKDAASRQAAGKRLSRAMAAGIASCAAGIFFSLWAESVEIGEVAWVDAWPVLADIVRSTHYGRAGLAALAILGVALLMHLFLCRQGKQGKTGCYLATMALLLAAVAAVRVSVSHAFEHGALSMAAWIEWLHLLLISLWTGMVFIAGWIVLPLLSACTPQGGPDQSAYPYLQRMSAWATVALAGIVATGGYNTYRSLTRFADLPGSDYGRTLLFKLVFVLIAALLGGFNRFFGLPAVQADASSPERSPHALRTVISVLKTESAALSIVLAAAAVLVNSAPPASS